MYLHLVDNNLLPNCPINKTDIMAAEEKWGPDVGCLQGKTVRHPEVHARPITLGIPLHIVENHMKVKLTTDILTRNAMKIFISMSRGLKFITGEHIRNVYELTLNKCAENVKNIYTERGFIVKHMLMDGQFECLRSKLTRKGIDLIVCSEDEHIGKIECLN
eukprot:15333447-Ditylum_brightwellii.AAC.1